MENINQYVEAALNGSPISVEAKKAGIWPEQLRRKVQKHPDYAKAKANGMLHAPGLPNAPDIDEKLFAEAVTDVVNGLTVTEAATKHGLAISTLTKKVHQAHPGLTLPKGGAGRRRDRTTRLEQAAAAVERCARALETAKKALQALQEPHATA